MPRAVRIAFVVSIVLSILSCLAFFQSPFALVSAAIYGCAAFGLRRSSAKAGFGAALWHAVSALEVIVVLLRVQSVQDLYLNVAWPVAALALTWIYFRAGRALQGDPTKRGSAIPSIPWIAATTIFQILPSLTILFGTPFIIPTGSMEDTLLIGDHIFVSSWDGTNAARGDLVVFKYPVDPTQTFNKRIVGIPGDHIRITNKQLYVDDKPAYEPYVNHKTDYIDSYRDNFPSQPNTHIENNAIDMLQNHMTDGQIVVPARAYFVMGDNRDQSLDSRYFGFVPQDDIIGKPQFIYWSVEAPLNAPASAAVSPWWSAKTRWSRLFMKLEGYSF